MRKQTSRRGLRGRLGAMFAMALAVAALTGLPGVARAELTVKLTLGQAKSRKFTKQVLDARVVSADPRIVEVSLSRDGDRIIFRPVAPGTTTVTVTGKVARFQSGIPNSGGDGPNSIPLAKYRPVRQVVRVVVSRGSGGSGGASGRLDDVLAEGRDAGEASETTSSAAVVIKPGQTRSSTFRSQVREVRVRTSNAAIATVRFVDGSKVVITGVSPGRATITVTGKTVRFNTGIPSGEGGVPLNADRAFSNTYSVQVVPESTDRADFAYRRAIALLNFLEGKMATAEREWPALRPDKNRQTLLYPAKKAREDMAAAKTRLTQERDKYRDGKRTEKQFVDLIYSRVESSISAAWRVVLQETKHRHTDLWNRHSARAQPFVVNYQRRKAELADQHGAGSDRYKAELRRMRAEGERQVLDPAIRDHAAITDTMASRRGMLVVEAWRWVKLGRQHSAAWGSDHARGVEAMLYQQFAYGLKNRGADLHRRLFNSSSTTRYSELDKFIAERKRTTLDTIVFGTLDLGRGMDAKFAAAKVESMRP